MATHKVRLISSHTLIKLLTLLTTLFTFAFLFVSAAIAQDGEDGDVTADIVNSFDFQRLSGMVGWLQPHGNDHMGDLIDKSTGGLTPAYRCFDTR